ALLAANGSNHHGRMRSRDAPTETMGVQERVVYSGSSRLIRHIVKIAGGVRMAIVYRWRDNLMLERKGRSAGLHDTGRRERLPDHRLNRTDRHSIRMLREGSAVRGRLS